MSFTTTGAPWRLRAGTRPLLARSLLGIASQAEGFGAVLDGCFTGGYITRHYGQATQGVHAMQLEMTRSSHMEERLPFDHLAEVARRVQPPVRRMLEAMPALVGR